MGDTTESRIERMDHAIKSLEQAQHELNAARTALVIAEEWQEWQNRAPQNNYRGFEPPHAALYCD